MECMENVYLNREFRQKCPLLSLSRWIPLSREHSSEARDRQLACTVLSRGCAAPTSLEHKSSESGPGVGCGWLSELGNALVIIFYSCLHFNFQIPHPQPPSLACVSPPASHLTMTANLTLTPFLQKHLTLCKNLASIFLLLLPQTRIISISRQHCQTAAWVLWALPGTTVAPFFLAKGQWPLVASCQETLSKILLQDGVTRDVD